MVKAKGRTVRQVNCLWKIVVVQLFRLGKGSLGITSPILSLYAKPKQSVGNRQPSKLMAGSLPPTPTVLQVVF